MEQPEDCPNEFYSVMLDCWAEEPDFRPSFAKLYEQIGDIIEEFADVVSALGNPMLILRILGYFPNF